jgi:hypothetical protein
MLSIHIMQCTTQIAYEMKGLRVPLREVLDIITRYLKLSRRSQLFPEQVLDDIRRFFGLITTTPDGYCQFVHKTIHDYLAARYSVENGLFQPARVTEWDLRAAYAASSLHDATQSLHCAFVNSRSIEAVRECLSNDARFDVELVARSVFSHFDVFRDYNYTYTKPEPSGTRRVTVSCKCDFFDLADEAFLDAIVRKASQVRHTNGVDAVLVFCMSEYWRRKFFVPRDAVPFVLDVFGSLDTVVAVCRSGNLDEFILRTVIQT